ncbi:choice-of-anchor A family protein [Luteolibacter sp. Populi]|uniref:choice-of-anchor A family protein n=1 Tax=Luteolibacter sp. Populi TaxID=3230487 RepID=UPI003464F879
MKTKRTLVPSLLACLVTSSAGLHASTLSLASPYNVYVLGDMQESNVDSEGRVAVGGNATLTNYGVGSKFQGNPASAGNTLVVGGNLAYNGGEVHYGNTVYGGTLSGSFGSPNGSITHGTALDFASTNTSLLTASAYWGNLTATGSTINYHGGVHMVGTSSDLNIFTLSGAMLASSWGVVIDAPAGSTVLVNVTGTSDAFKNMGLSFQDLNNDHTGSTGRQNVIYNFFEATALEINGISIQGSILAPKATVNFGNGNVEGNLIAGNLIGNGEAHNYLFQGNLPSPTTVPEPATFMLSLAGAALLILRRRR